MSMVENTTYNGVSDVYQGMDATKTSEKKKVKGANTYGEPKLSDEGLKYYNSLKKKFSNMNFVLVASDKKAEAEMMKGNFATSGAMTVLIDEEKIEKMATDEKYREKMEAVIANASAGSNQFASAIASTGVKVSAYGLTIDDKGTAQYFAVIDESLVKQRERIEEKAEENKAKRKEEQAKETKESGKVQITASSMEELIRKLKDYASDNMMNGCLTEEEKQIGQSFDFSV